jgi:hypothetical protein
MNRSFILILLSFFLGLSFEKSTDITLPEAKISELSQFNYRSALRSALLDPQICRRVIDQLEKVEKATRYALRYHDSSKNVDDIISETFHSPHSNRLPRLEALLQNPSLLEKDYMNLAHQVNNHSDVFVMKLIRDSLGSDESKSAILEKINQIFNGNQELMELEKWLLEISNM